MEEDDDYIPKYAGEDSEGSASSDDSDGNSESDVNSESDEPDVVSKSDSTSIPGFLSKDADLWK